MAFNHRKLFSAPEQAVKVSDACDFFCDSTRNTEGYCPISCISKCPTVCYRPLPSLIPSPPPPTPPPLEPQGKSSNLPFLLLIALSILAAICFLFCCYTLYKLYKKWDESRTRRRRRSAELQLEETRDQFVDQDHGLVVDHPIWYIRTVGLQSSVINSIPICKYKRGDGLVEGTDCSVCLSEFQEEDTLRLLPKCNHAFHLPCIDKWLGSHTNCPLCRAVIVNQETAAAPEQSVDNSGVREENQVVISQSRGEFTREREDGECELMGTEEEGEREIETPEAEVVHQLMRRSVSLDSVSASMISLAIANAYPRGISGNSDSQMRNQNESNVDMVPKRVDVDGSLPKFVGNCSTGKSLQKGPISMKRSMSCSGKVLFLKYARSRNSIFP